MNVTSRPLILFFLSFLSFASAALGGCGDQTPLEPGQVTAGSAGTGAPAETGSAGASVTTGSSALGDQGECGPAGDALVAASIGDLRKTIEGTWALCSPLGLFRRPQDGILIGLDDRYRFLERKDGKLVPISGLTNEGQVSFIDTSAFNGRPFFQTDFDSDAGGGIIAAPLIVSDSPRQLIINNNGVETYVYGAVR